MLGKKVKAVLLRAENTWEQAVEKDGNCAQAIAVVYITEDLHIARSLTKKNLPCIYMEAPGEEGGFASGISCIYQGRPDLDAGENGNYGMEEEYLLRIWQRHYHLPWTIVQTPRLLIRESVMEDLPAFLAMYEEERDNADVTPFTDEPADELRAYIDQHYPFYGYGLWSVVEKSSAQVIGRAGFSEAGCGIELSYLIAKKWRRQGYAYEAAQAILARAQEETGEEKICLRTSKENTASAALAGKLGFEKCEEPLLCANASVTYYLLSCGCTSNR